MKILFIADHIEKLHPGGDTSLAMAEAYFHEGHDVYWTSCEHVGMDSLGLELKIQKMVEIKKRALPQLDQATWKKVEGFDVFWIRKDPPFDEHYLRLCWLLSPWENKRLFINQPSKLLRFHEKMLPFEVSSQGFLDPSHLIPTWLGSSEFIARQVSQDPSTQFIVKPWMGYGGQKIELLSRKELTGQLEQKSSPREWTQYMVQPFLSQVTQKGDRRVLYLGGDIIGDVVRMPQDGHFISNLAQGGKGVERTMEPHELQASLDLGRFLKASQIDFAGADFIGDKLSEVNVTSPTGILAFTPKREKEALSQIVDWTQAHLKTS